MRLQRLPSHLLLAGLAGGLMLLAILGRPSQPARARQTSTGWSAPTNLSNSEQQSTSPSIAVDRSGGVHVVWAEEAEDGRSFIAYAHWEEGNWSPANEILTSPSFQVVNYPTLAIDSQGTLHIVWIGDATLYYSRAYAPLAGSAQNWSAPRALEFVQSDIDHPSLVINDQDVLNLVYSIDIGSNSGIYSMQSSNGGKNWSDPVTIFQNRRSDRMVNYARLAAGPDDALHAAWVEFNYPETFPPIGIRYASSQDGGANWSVPISLADGPYDYPGIATRGSNEVHVVWSGTEPDRFRFHRWSADGGQTWSDTYRNTDMGGYLGLPALVVDSAGTLHWLTNSDIFSTGTWGLYHTTWQGGVWSPGEVALGDEPVNQNSQDVVAAVALGNKLHAVLQQPVASEIKPDGWQYETYALWLGLDSPTVPAAELATPTVSLPTPSAVADKVAPTVRPTLDAWLATPPTSGGGGMLSVLLTSMLGALVVLAVAILFFRRRQ